MTATAELSTQSEKGKGRRGRCVACVSHSVRGIAGDGARTAKRRMVRRLFERTRAHEPGRRPLISTTNASWRDDILGASRRFTQSRIHLAARQAALRSIQVLLVRGASATVLDGQGWSCLHHLATSSADDESKALALTLRAALRAGRPTPMRRHLRVAANTQV